MSRWNESGRGGRGAAGAVWRASRAAVRRRRLQTFVIGFVLMFSTATIVIALGLLDASSAPFERAFNRQHGAQLIATFDQGKVTNRQLTDTARQSGASAAAGPFGQAVITIPESPSSGSDQPVQPGPLTVVGRADPGGPVDRLDLWHGRWATSPGEVVIDLPTGAPLRSGDQHPTLHVPGGPDLAVVGYAYSVSQSAGAWVAPGQLAALHPTSAQMLYRFAHAGTESEIRAETAAVGAGLPQDALTASQSYLALKQDFAAGSGVYVPLLMAFGILGLVVGVLIVANVVSGAVVSGFRHIGVLKALGFTPNQVVAVYLLMVSVPAVTGTVLGTALGAVLERPLLRQAVQGVGLGSAGFSPWVLATALLGMPAVVLLAALLPALRAHRLSAAQAISAGSAPRTGRALRVQRRLAGTRLPRSVSLGLGLPFARPGRTALTVAAVVLGVTTVTLSTGLVNTVVAYGRAEEQTGAVQVNVHAGSGRGGETPRTIGDPATEALLRSLPGAVHVTADTWVDLRIAGHTQSVIGEFYRGDSATLGYQLVQGHWLDGPGQIVVSPGFLSRRGLTVGDRLTLQADGCEQRATVVGEVMSGDPDALLSDWQTLAGLAPDTQADQYAVQLAPGTDVTTYLAAVKAADPGLYPEANTAVNAGTVLVSGFSSVFAVLLGAVAALGVFNTVVLNTRERRRDLGMLKSIGMTPRQVTVMVVASMAALGVLGGLLGLPLGILAHRAIVSASTSGSIVFPASMMNVWQPPVLAALALAGVLIAVLGALVPARSAARLTIAEVLRNE